MSSQTAMPRVIGPEDGEKLPWSVGVNRYLVDAKDTAGTISIVEHRVDPRSLPGPVHRHSREDEYSFVLEGRVEALLGTQHVAGEAGDLIIKPRGEWHTFWNPTDEPLRILEIITPGGLENLFRTLSDGALDPATLPPLAGEYGCELDFERTMELVEKQGLKF